MERNGAGADDDGAGTGGIEYVDGAGGAIDDD